MDKKRIWVVGKNGMVGQTVYSYLTKNENFDVYGTTKAEFDILTSSLGDFLDEHPVDVVINCAGILNDNCDKNRDIARQINSFFPQSLGMLQEEYNFHLIHISTDCVFSGDNGPYAPTDIPDGTSWYSLTKQEGEATTGMVIRTSIIGHNNYSDSETEGLLEWFLKQKECLGYSKVIWNGITSLELAKIIEKVIEKDRYYSFQIGNTPISKYELLCLVKKIYDLDTIITPFNSGRPSNKCLINNCPFPIPSYETMIREMKEYNEQNQI